MKFYLIEQLLTICSNNNKISKYVKYTLPVIFCTHYSLFYFGRAESCKHEQLAFGWKDCLMYQICYQLLLFFMCLKSHFVPGWCDIGHYWRQWGDRRSRSGGQWPGSWWRSSLSSGWKFSCCCSVYLRSPEVSWGWPWPYLIQHYKLYPCPAV